MRRVKSFGPLLATDAKDLSTLPYPLLASVKMDGIRAIVTPDGAKTRAMKPIPNRYIRQQLEMLPHGLDGEIGLVGKTGTMDFRASTSAVMAYGGTPDFRFFVFDDCSLPDEPYHVRCSLYHSSALPRWVAKVEQVRVDGAVAVRELFAEAVRQGHEGLILRRADAPYKFGRSTLKEAYLLKVKPWEDTEAMVVNMVPEYENTNEAKTNALGHTERSSAKAGKVQKESMGALVVEKAGKRFEIGTGFTAVERESIWRERDSVINKLFAKFKFVSAGGYDVPRHCVFLGFRSREDMS